MARPSELASFPDCSSLAGAVCAFGVFDGVHRGHQRVLSDTITLAHAEGRQAVIITFDKDPDELFAKEGFKKIMTNEERIMRLKQMGADEVIVIPFTRTFAALAPDEALELLFASNVPAAIFVGQDFRFGAKAQGTVNDLARWGKRRGMSVKNEALLEAEQRPITSTRIRALLEVGDVAAAACLLGHGYSFTGHVHHGRSEGAQIGFKTANMNIPEGLKVISDGVYGGYALVDGVRYRAAINVGIPPTFEERAQDNLEVHILDLDKDLYGKDICIEFIEFLRPLARFESEADLIEAIANNVRWIEENL